MRPVDRASESYHTASLQSGCSCIGLQHHMDGMCCGATLQLALAPDERAHKSWSQSFYRPRGTMPVSRYRSYRSQWRLSSVRVVSVLRAESACCHSAQALPSCEPVVSPARCWRSCCLREASCSAWICRARCVACWAACVCVRRTLLASASACRAWCSA